MQAWKVYSVSTNEIIPKRSKALWLNRNYMLLWSGLVVSNVGSQVSQLAFPLLILALTGLLIQYIGVVQTVFICTLGMIAFALASNLNRYVRNAQPFKEIANV